MGKSHSRKIGWLKINWAITSSLSIHIYSGGRDENFLREVGNVLNVDYRLQGEIINILQMDGAYGWNEGE